MSRPSEQYYRLKYQYFIDADNITEKILSSNEFENYNKKSSTNSPRFDQTLEELLDLIFDTILESSKPYTNFLTNYDRYTHSFFGEVSLEHPLCGKVSGADYTNSSTKLHLLSIQNHLILESFFTYLSSTKPEYLPKTLCLNSNDSHYFRYGYFDWENYYASPHSQQRKSYGSIYRATYIQRLKSFEQKPDKHYSKKLITTTAGYSTLKPSNSKRHAYAMVSSYQHIFLDFLYKNRAVHYFDKAIEEGLPLAKKYNSLYEDSMGIQNTLSLNLDKLLFIYPMEKAYGFSTFHFLIQHLEKIYSSKHSEKKRTYNDLVKNEFLELIPYYLECPLVYNRSFLLKYACDAIIYGDLISLRYLEVPKELAMGKVSKDKKSKTQLLSKGSSLLEHYILSINRLILPLLTDLWEITIKNLNNHIKNSEIILNLNTLSKYVQQHFDILTFDFSQLSEEEICSCCHYGENMNQIRKNIKNFISEGTPSQKKPSELLRKKWSEETINNWENLLRNYIKGTPNILSFEDSLNKLCNVSFSDNSKNDKTEIKMNHARNLYQISTTASLAYKKSPK